MTMKSLYALVGMKHRPPHVEALVKALPLGETMELRRDHDNEHDPLAIKTFARGIHIGFIARRDNKKLANWMDLLARSGKDDTIEGRYATDGSGWPCVEVEI